ncbi:MAG: hypothetical protein AAFO80_16395, partial [Pseudomonadota bacterium]
MTEIPTIEIERLVTDGRMLFLPSPCKIRSLSAGIERLYDRDEPDAEDVLRTIFLAHLGPRSPDLEPWIEWCLDHKLPKVSET